MPVIRSPARKFAPNIVTPWSERYLVVQFTSLLPLTKIRCGQGARLRGESLRRWWGAKRSRRDLAMPLGGHRIGKPRLLGIAFGLGIGLRSLRPWRGALRLAASVAPDLERWALSVDHKSSGAVYTLPRRQHHVIACDRMRGRRGPPGGCCARASYPITRPEICTKYSDLLKEPFVGQYVLGAKDLGDHPMAKRDKAGHKTVADTLQELIRSEDNRRQVRKAFGLEVEPGLPPTLASLLAAVEEAHKETLNRPHEPVQIQLEARPRRNLDGVRRGHRPARVA